MWDCGFYTFLKASYHKSQTVFLVLISFMTKFLGGFSPARYLNAIRDDSMKESFHSELLLNTVKPAVISPTINKESHV